MTPELKQALIVELRRLADGGNPVWPKRGVCANVTKILLNQCLDFMEHELAWQVSNVYGSSFPIGLMLDEDCPSEFIRPGLWEGERGSLRRLLAGFMACWIETEL